MNPGALLAIDPGTSCGWALRSLDGTYVSGTWDLKPRRQEGGGMRFLRFRRFFLEAVSSGGVVSVCYEEVRRHLGVDAAHVYGGLVAQLTSICEERGLPYCAIHYAIAKRVATGKGNADKPAMRAAAEARWPGYRFVDDNEVDARWLAEAAVLEVLP